MLTFLAPEVSRFALDVSEGLSEAGQKKIAPRYFYDDLGTALFEAITQLPEYGLTRADERLLRGNADRIATYSGPLSLVAELGSGSGKKTSHVLRALANHEQVLYRPIDVSPAALDVCKKELGALANVKPVCADWLDGIAEIAGLRDGSGPLLLLFLGSSIGNLDRSATTDFLRQLRSHLRRGDFFLLGADLVKSVDRMIAAYDDPTGVTAAFNLNLLGRMNRELGANFDLRTFAHEARWNKEERRIEMHLLCCRNQTIRIEALEFTFTLNAGETIWTESSHKFTKHELDEFAQNAGFDPVDVWIDEDWPFAEALWRVV